MTSNVRYLACSLVTLMAASLSTGCGPDDEKRRPDLTVDWGVGDGRPGCVYDAKRDVVNATLTITGDAPERTRVTVTVTAHADENTSRPVGSNSRSVEVEGAVDEIVAISIPVDRAPHVDIDGVTACSRSVAY